jgi:hypothetical protein
MHAARFHMGHMAGVFEQAPAHVRNHVRVGLHGARRGLVVAAGQQQGRHVDRRQALDDAPLAQAADDVELGGPFMAWYTVGSASIAAKVRATWSGIGRTRHAGPLAAACDRTEVAC